MADKPDYAHAKKLDVTKNVDSYAAIKENMAMKYPFELDPFQQQAVCCMEKGESVFVAAHTSAGKTVVAEYAVALCKKNETRVIYTSPIKALSNQKFRDFKIAFGDVGLITGDIQLHSEANCLIMTTEILRSMLYNGSEVVRELEWVIFDEVHYINDIERGHVWEEVLIMLPSHVKIVMLSATVPNCMEFADWVGRIKQRIIYVIQTLKRPVPLEHFLYTGQDGKTRNDKFCIYKEGTFLTAGYHKAVEAKMKKAQSQKTGAGPMPRRTQGGGSCSNPWMLNKNNKNVYISLIEHLRTSELLPMIVFIFSRQRCDETAQLLQSVDLTTEKEKSAIHRFFDRCIDRLKGTDKQLPQVLLMQEHCKRGFAVHHSGILPIIKEVVELLFQQGLVKILFATETFAMGVNMPARTVVFDTIEKHDGKERRLLNATEYVQMAGRAGRRGLDSTGTVIILAKGSEPPDIASLKTVLDGKPIKLESRFRMTYGMMLNLLRVEHMRIEDMLQRSYVERASLRMVLSRKERLKQIDAEIAALPAIDCAFCYPQPDGKPAVPSILDYFNALSDYFDALKQAWQALAAKSVKLFSAGRLLIIHHDPLGIVGRLAVILKTQFTPTGQFLMTLFVPTPVAAETKNEEIKEAVFKKGLTKEEQQWRKKALLLGHSLSNGIEGIEQLGFDQTYTGTGSFTILEDIGLDSIMAVCKRQIQKVDADVLIAEHKRLSTSWGGRSKSPDRSVRKIMMDLDQMAKKITDLKEAATGTAACDQSDVIYILGEDRERKELELIERLRRFKEIRQRLLDPEAFPCTHCANVKEHMEKTIKRCQLQEGRDQLKYQTSSDSLQFSGEYAGRLKVLRTLNYIDRQNMVGLKGKVACEISNQELLITELILDNKFIDRRCPEIAAMLSALTCQFELKGNNNRRAHFNGNMAAAIPLNAISLGATNGSAQQQSDGIGNNNSGGGGNLNENAAQREGQPVQVEAPVERVPRELLKELENDIVEAATRIDSVQKACSVTSLVVDELKFGLMEVVHQWATGMEFSQIMRLTDAQEGIIVRCIQRLDEVCKDVRKAALIVGSPELAEKMEETSEAIRRDIVFAASLYVTETD